MYRPSLRKRYRATRRAYPNAPACVILAAVRNDELTEIIDHLGRFHTVRPRDYYSGGYVYNPRIADERGQLTERRWVENTARAGLRFVGYADELVRLDHRGWHTHPDGWTGEVCRGAVWQLPARGGRPLFVYGRPDPINEGAALIDFDYELGEDSDGRDAMRDAARQADGLAERDAEREREYHEKWDARQRIEEARDEIAEARAEHTKLIAAIRSERAAARRYGKPECPYVLAQAIADKLESWRRDVRRARRVIRETLEQYGDDVLTDEYA